jgi:hypothetical protein
MTGMEIFKTAAIGAGLIAAGTAMRVTTRADGTPATDGPADEPDALTD